MILLFETSFTHYNTSDVGQAKSQVRRGGVPEISRTLTWERKTGKSGTRKDSYVDLKVNVLICSDYRLTILVDF